VAAQSDHSVLLGRGLYVSRLFFISTTTRPRRWWQVRIHDTADELRAAAERYNPKRHGDTWDDVYGVHQPFGTYINRETGARRYPSNGFAGVIRFVEGRVTSEIVAHELVHAALWCYRMNHQRNVRLGVDCGPREEDLAYIYGELYASFETAWRALDGHPP
jgi:hypothetical protein